MNRSFNLIALFAAGLLIAGCGSGGGGETPVAEEPAQVPAEASTTTQALVAWTGAQAENETIEPLGMTAFMPPVSDTDEPAAIR